tara:strand:- start:6009 stop:7337 length:1329 start_codon:yes stop_codon:yes gene_type:complete
MKNLKSNKFLHSWGLYPKSEQIAHPVSWLSDVSSKLEEIFSENGETIAYGNGRSYGDSCYAANDHLLHTRNLNKFISVDWINGRVVAESGVTLEEILSVSIPNGWFLAVTPGTKFVTLGGALANDVHGKNHHVRGTFGCNTLSFGLIRSDLGSVKCSRTENEELFSATIAGLGLTGIITWVEIQLIPIKSTQVDTTIMRFNSLSDFFLLSEDLDAKHEYGVAWIDCLAKGEKLGRGVYIVGNHSKYGDLSVRSPKKLSLPFTPPISLVNKITLLGFNNLYWYKHKSKPQKIKTDFDSFFYPLDGINNWNRMYGKAGFQQYQCIIPNYSAKEIIKDLLREISKSGQGSFLAVLKQCGNIKSPGLISFPCAGVSLALDFPMTFNLLKLFKKLDFIVLQSGGRLYPAKDAHMSADLFKQFYSNWGELEKLRDPHLNSKFWKRVTL